MEVIRTKFDIYETKCTDETCAVTLRFNESEIEKIHSRDYRGDINWSTIGITCPECKQILHKKDFVLVEKRS